MKICGSSSINCSDHCGSGCASFVNSHLEYKNLKDKINKNYEQKGTELKSILTQLNSERLINKNFNDDLETLKTSIDNDINQYENKKKIFKNFINEMFNLSDRYQSNIQKINYSTSLVVQFENFNSEENFDLILEKIKEKESDLNKASKLDEIRQDLANHKVSNFSKFENSDKIAKLIEIKETKLNETTFNIEEIEQKLFSQKNSIFYVQEIQSKINLTFKSLKLKLSTVDKEVKDFMVLNKTFKNDIDGTVEKIKENMDKKTIVLVKEKLEKMENIVDKLNEQLKLSTTDEIFFQALKLLDKIMKKSLDIKRKFEKIERLKILNLKLNKKISQDRSNIYNLKENIKSINNRLILDKFGKISCL